MTRPQRLSGLPRAAPAVLFILLVLAVYSDVVFQRRNFAGRDLLAYNLPMEKITHDAYARGALPVWNPFVSGGRPHLPNPNAGALYPLRILLSVFSFPVAMRIFPLFHWAAAGVGVLMLLRSLDLSRAAAWIGAVTYVFSGVGVSYVYYTHIQPGMALLPWILWIFSGRDPTRRSAFLLLTILLALDLLAADVFTIGLACGCALLWIVLEHRAPRIKAGMALLGAFGLALLAAAPQIVATLLWVGETSRAVLGIRLRSVFLFSVPWPRLFEFVIPYPFGANWSVEDARVWGWGVFHDRMMGLFTTLYPGAFAVIALFASLRLKGRGVRFARVLFVLGLILTVLPSLLPAAWGGAVSPVPLRNPEKFAVVLMLSLAILSGRFFDRLRGSPGIPRWSLIVGCALTLLAVLAVRFPADAGRSAAVFVGDTRFWRIAAQEVPRALTEAALLWAFTVLALSMSGLRSRAGLAGSLALLTVIPIAANRRIAETFREEAVFAPTAFARQLARWDPTGEFGTLSRPGDSRLAKSVSGSDPGFIETDRDDWTFQTQALWDRVTVLSPDFDVGDFLRLEGLRRWALHPASSSQRANLFESLSLRWGIRYRDQPPYEGFHRIRRAGLQVWDENTEAAPRIRVLEKFREEPEPMAVFRALATLDAGEVVLQSGARRRASSPPGRIQMLRQSAERLSIRVQVPQDSWLFVLRGFWRHRDVLVDGVPVEAVPAQLAFTAVAVPAGDHRVDWKERLPGGEISVFGPVLFVLAVIWILVRKPPSISAAEAPRSSTRGGRLAGRGGL